MYQHPDFVKVSLDVKDNFAAYASCYRNSYSVYTINQQEVPSGKCETHNILNYASGETDYQCYIGDMTH